MNFNGRDETVHLEHGQSFGIPWNIYQCLAQAAISCSTLAGIEPVLLEPLSDGRPGAVCTLYGNRHAFWIQLECEPPPVMVLSAATLDSTEDPEWIADGNATCSGDWRSIVHLMLEAEGYECPSAEQIAAWDAQWLL
jgi:hypothetical protein